jgi:hypothetical protein
VKNISARVVCSSPEGVSQRERDRAKGWGLAPSVVVVENEIHLQYHSSVATPSEFITPLEARGVVFGVIQGPGAQLRGWSEGSERREQAPPSRARADPPSESDRVSEELVDVRTALAVAKHTRGEIGRDGVLHVLVGPVTVHLDRAACEDLTTTLARAMVALAKLYPKVQAPSLTLVRDEDEDEARAVRARLR